MNNNFFEKPIDRYIETVIKADDKENISNEVTEYVITNEIAKKIRDFFHEYNNYEGANGVWISGFFGSGKSHLLKILSYVLANLEYDDYKCGELFADKLENDVLLKADILKAVKIPSESILFNIDQQSQITTKTDAKAILSVFYKVFYDHLGFYGFQPHVAEFETWVDKQGKYKEFKDKFYVKFEKSWEEARIDYFDPMVIDVVAEVLGEIFNTDASKYENILDEIEDKQKQSIEDFAERVYSYIKSKPAGFRLNFFVDEIGQYISDNTKLMLNLQTVAESLATKTKGKSWILVTSQEDIEKVVGDMNKQQQNDFSRIQARFKNKVSLTSANVDEVIEKRLLKKKAEAQKTLLEKYKSISSHLDSILSFSDTGVQFKGYKSDLDFSNKYPFVSYQFDLFQNCRRALSQHNAFQGKHAAIGERSMLGVFQQVGKKVDYKDFNTLVSFDMMFEGIRSELKGEIQSSINMAERNLDNVYAIRIVKTLFLLKYFTNFKATRRNISVLLINDINIDLKKHEKSVEEALNILENQSYIQRNGDLYEFLTNDEKDVEEDIKNTDIDDQAITQHLKEIFYDEIIRDNKIRFNDNKQDYEFTSKIDGSTIGKEKELEIDIVTEFNYNYSNEDIIKAQTMFSSGMKLVLAPDPVFLKDLRLFLKTKKYVMLKQSTTNRAEYKRILQEKGEQNAKRGKTLVLIANNALANSTIYINGSKVESAQTSDGKVKVVNAFQDLIRLVYPNLRMIGNTLFSEETVKSTILKPISELFGLDEQMVSEAESEIITFIERRRRQSDRTTLNDVKSYFLMKPYGWYSNAIWTLIARLYKRSLVELKSDSNLLEDDAVIYALLNSSCYANTLLEVPKVVDKTTMKKLQQVYSETFDEPCPYIEPKDLATAFKTKLKGMLSDIDKLLIQKNQYNFLESLYPFSEKLAKLSEKDYSYFLHHINEFEDELLDFKEEILDPIKRFMNGDQLVIYDSIRKVLDGDTSNLDYVKGDELQTLKDLFKNDKPYLGNRIKDAKAAKDELVRKVLEQINKEKAETKEAIEQMISELKNKDDFTKLTELQQSQIIEPFNEELKKLQIIRYIAVIRDTRLRIKYEVFTHQLNEMLRLVNLHITSNPSEKNTGATGTKEPQVVHYINRNNIKLIFSKTELKTETDVDEYIEAYRKALKEQIKNNRRIQL